MSIHQLPARPSRRSGFTLVEMLMVVAILSVLAALILPAVQNSVVSAREAAVVSEISQLEAAIAAFRNRYGIDPPSRITLYTTESGWNGSGANAKRSKALIRRMFGRQVDFAAPSSAYPSNWGAEHTLTGAECLVFFLGGILDSTGQQPMGFCKNPETPFKPASSGEQRDGPFFDFKADRLVKSPRSANSNAFLVYLDPLPSQEAPYVYVSSNDGQGYNHADLAVGSSADLESVYYSTNGTPAVPYKPKSFQIISPGYDHLYGRGGYFNPKDAQTSLSVDRPSGGLNAQGRAERDNLTNFHGGRLGR